MLEDDIHTSFTGDPAHLVSDLLLVMIDGEVGSQFPRLRQFRIITRRCNHGGVKHLCDLDCRRAHARPRAQYQNPLALLDLRTRHQHVPRRQEHQWHTRRLVETQRIGNGNNIDLGHRDEFAVATIHSITQNGELPAEILLPGAAHCAVIAEHHRRNQNALSFLYRGNVLANVFHHSSNIAAIDVRQVHPRQAFTHPQVEMIERARLHPHHHLVLPHLRFGNISVEEDLRSAELLENDRLHREASLGCGGTEKGNTSGINPGKDAITRLYNDDVLKIFALILVMAASLAGPLAVAQTTPHTVLILPFENKSKAPGLEWISEAFPEVLGEGIGSGAIYIIPRDDRNLAFERMGVPIGIRLSRETLYRISEQIDADYVVLGKYDYDGQTFTATAQLLDMNKLYLAPEVKESGPLVNMVEVQRALAWDLLRGLSPDTLSSKEAFLQSGPPIRLDAFENYVRGEVATTRQEKLQRFREAVRLNPGYTQAMFQLGKTYYANREYESAASWFERVPAADPLSGQASFYRGLSCYYVGDYECSESAFKFIEAKFPLPEVVNNLGVVMGRRGKRSEIDYLQKAVNSDPNNSDYHFNLAVAYARVFDNAHAVQELKEALRLHPSDAEARSFLETLNASATTAVRQTSANSAKLPLQRIQRNYDETSYQQLALEVERTAEARLANGDPKEHAAFHSDRGQQLLSQGFYGDAAKAFEEAITLDPTNASAHAGLAQAYSAIGKDKEAIAEASAALKLQPSPGAYLLLARQNLKDNKLSAASEEVDRALELDPHNQDAQALKRSIDEKLAPSKN